MTFLLLLLVCFYWYRKVSARVRACEELLTRLHTPVPPPPPPPPPLPEQCTPQPPTMPHEGTEQYSLPRLQIPQIIRENWMGVFGSLAVVTGAVFFGLTSTIMQHPEAKLSVMIAVSSLLLGLCYRLKNQNQWMLLCGWLKSIAASVILVATLGAGSIPGLQCIDYPPYAIAFLCVGIAVNMILSLVTPYQSVASLHVILSSLAFCLVPQTLILLPLGAFTACLGLWNAYRSKWDLHSLLIITAFSLQNFFWYFALKNALVPWMHGLAITTCLVVGLIAAIIHYSNKYASPTLEPLPFVTHIANWGLLAGNIWIHAPTSVWGPFVLGTLAACGFLVANVARKKHIQWLYHTDTLFSQLVAVLAIISILQFRVRHIDISLLLLCETVVFNMIYQKQKEQFLFRVGSIFQWIASIVTLIFCIGESYHPISLCIRLGIATMLSWGSYLLISSFEAVSITALFGSLFFSLLYAYGFDLFAIQILAVTTCYALCYWKKFRQDTTSDFTFSISLLSLHLISWYKLLALPSHSSCAHFLGLFLLDFVLITRNSLDFPRWQKNFTFLLVYALGAHTALMTYVFTKEMGVLIPGVAFLLYSLFALEAVHHLSKFFHDKAILESIVQVGWAFLICFLGRFITIHLQVDPIWHGLSLRWITEGFALCTLLYWISAYPKNRSYSPVTEALLDWLIELFLGFITLLIFVETLERARPVLWIGMAICLLFINWPKRRYTYSWAYFIASIVHMTFVTSSLTMPSLFFFERYHILTLVAIALQFSYACIVHKWPPTTASKLYTQASLSILLPVFVGVGLFLAFNFEKAILTLLWVGLIGVYLATGLVIKSKRTIQIGMVALVLCSGRMLIFDLVQTNLSVRALVFVGVGGLMLGISALYKKYKHRIEAHDQI